MTTTGNALRKATRQKALPLNEEWKDIPGYGGIYKIHWRGCVRSLISNKILSPGKSKGGYMTVSLLDKTHTIHRLVAKSFIKNPKNKKCVNHKDGNKLNNHYANLEWATYSENNSHAFELGLRSPINKAKGIIQYDMDGNEIARYRTSECLPEGFYGGCVCQVCNGKRNHHKGYKWSWIN